MTIGSGSKTSRRRFLGGSAAAAGMAALGQVGGLPLTSSASAQQGRRRPNILFLMVDEQRHPVSYETAALAAFRANYLRTQQTLAQTGVTFNRHYAASVACVPSRTSMMTGHYPSLHGCSQTDGAAKNAVEQDMFWLDASTVPTLGDYFRAGGYDTYWIGKWHVSHGDILQPGTQTGLPSYDSLGRPDEDVEDLYRRANRLDGHGFDGWIGREPHGVDPRDSGWAAGVYKPTGEDVEPRDPQITSQVLDKLNDLEGRSRDAPPWVLGASFLGPHDIALWGLFARLGNLFPQTQYTYDFSISSAVPAFEDLFDRDKFRQTHQEDLSTKPQAQESYRDTYSQWMQPTLGPQFYRYYYELHKLVDAELGKVYDALKRSRFFDDTIIVFTSDHGDLLGAHGGMFQKWYGAYDESTRIPLVISGSGLGSPGRTVDLPTSHVDLIPTLLGLAGLDQDDLRGKLNDSHTEARPLVGRDLSKLVTGASSASTFQAPIYFMTDDDPSRGDEEVNPIGLGASTVVQPNKLDTVITVLDGQLWKYTEYRDDPAYWTTPGTQDYRDRPLQQPPSNPGTYTQPYQITVKTEPVQPQPRDFELYNLGNDPLELRNLALESAYNGTRSQLADVLREQRRLKRLTPGGGSSSSSRAANEVRRDPSDDKERRLTETQRQQRERSNQLGLDDYRTEGNVVEVHLDASPPYIVLGMRDGAQVVRLRSGGSYPEIRVGDYVEAEGVKEHEQLFEAESIVVTRAGQTVR